MSQASREATLRRLRATDVKPIALPDTAVDSIRYDDPLLQFQQTVEMVGGSVIRVPRGTAWPNAIRLLPVVTQSQRIASTFADCPYRNVDEGEMDHPRLLHDVDLMIAAGELAVAENGAIWVTDSDLRHRVLYFICQHLMLVIDANQLVHTLHDAYARLRCDATSFGAWISGPSKTADIEQSLVIGAHGARSLTVVVIGGEDSER